MLTVDPATGASEVLFTEKAAERITGSTCRTITSSSKDGSLIWWSERDGFGHLYRFATARWTPADQRRMGRSPACVGVDQDGRAALFHRRPRTTCWRSRSMRSTSPSPGADRAPDRPGFRQRGDDGQQRAQTLLVSRSTDDAAAAELPRRRDGQAARVDRGKCARRRSSLCALSWRATACPNSARSRREDGTDAALEDGQAGNGAGQAISGVLLPLWRARTAERDARLGRCSCAQAIVDKGYICFELDNRGSANRGVAFEKPIYRAMGGVEVRDQKAGARVPQDARFRRSGQDRHRWLVLWRIHDAQAACRPIRGSTPRASAARR